MKNEVLYVHTNIISISKIEKQDGICEEHSSWKIHRFCN